MTTMTPSTTSSVKDIHSGEFRAASASRSNRRSLVRGALLLVIVVAVVWAAWSAVGWSGGPRPSDVTKFTVAPRDFSVVLKEKGELKAARSTDVMCEVEGRSTIIYLVPEGTAVKEGDLLVELASDEIEDRIRQEELKETNALTAFEAANTELEIQKDQNESDIRKAELEIELTQLDLDKYEKADWSQRQKDAQIAIEEAKIVLERAKEDYDAAVKLRERNFITKTEFEQDKFDQTKAIWDLEKAEHAAKVLQKYTHTADLKKRQSDVDEAKKELERVRKNAEAEEAKKKASVEGKSKELQLIQDNLAKLRRQKEHCRIFAPTQGFVVYYSGGGGRHFMSEENQIREGATVRERQILMSLPDTSEMQVVVRVHEAKTDKLSLGQQANVTVEGVSDRTFMGTVTKIAVLADTQNRWLNPDLKEYETEITLEPTDAHLKPGVTAYTEILVEQVQAQAAVPVQAVYTKGSHRYVFTESGGKVGFTEVKLGSVGLEWAELRDGVKPGDQILLAFNDQQKRMIPDLPNEPLQMGPGAGGAARHGGGPGASAVAHEGPPSGNQMQQRRRPPEGAAPSPDQMRQRRRPPEGASRSGRGPGGAGNAGRQGQSHQGS